MSEVQGNRTIKIIGAFKLIKGLLLIALALGAFTLLKSNWENALTVLTRNFRVDPSNKHFRWLMTKVVGLSPKLPLILTGTLLYGTLFCTEGLGLIMQKRWAEYLSIIATASFLPMEVYEIIKHANVLKAVVTALNLAIVIYLILRLKKEKKKSTNK